MITKKQRILSAYNTFKVKKWIDGSKFTLLERIKRAYNNLTDIAPADY